PTSFRRRSSAESPARTSRSTETRTNGSDQRGNPSRGRSPNRQSADRRLSTARVFHPMSERKRLCACRPRPVLRSSLLLIHSSTRAAIESPSPYTSNTVSRNRQGLSRDAASVCELACPKAVRGRRIDLGGSFLNPRQSSTFVDLKGSRTSLE